MVWVRAHRSGNGCDETRRPTEQSARDSASRRVHRHIRVPHRLTSRRSRWAAAQQWMCEGDSIEITVSRTMIGCGIVLMRLPRLRAGIGTRCSALLGAAGVTALPACRVRRRFLLVVSGDTIAGPAYSLLCVLWKLDDPRVLDHDEGACFVDEADPEAHEMAVVGSSWPLLLRRTARFHTQSSRTA